MSFLDDLAVLFATEGTEDYLGESVTQAEHMLQAASLAEASGGSDALVAAALLHDIGHFRCAPAAASEAGGRDDSGEADKPSDRSGHELMAGRDNHHAERGANWLATRFGPEVSEPVRLHVAAKRYLCRAEPAYLDRLSAASLYTLSVQGGAMSEEEAAGLEREQHFAEAVQLRRFDEEAKDPGQKAPPFEHFQPLLERLCRPTQHSALGPWPL